MVKVARRVIGMKVACVYCGTILNFQKEDLRDCIRPILGFDTRYHCIDCPVCGKEVIVRNAETECWEDEVDMIYEENNTEEV